MFTGLIKCVGRIEEVKTNASGKLFWVKAEQDFVDEIKIDDSVAVNGVCQTAVQVQKNRFSFQAVHTTLTKTNLEHLRTGDGVNLELAMRLSDRLGGHLVSGHIPCQGKVLQWQQRGDNYEVWFHYPTILKKYLIKEGSIAIDGVSLTIADLDSERFMVSIIPHTWKQTLFHTYKAGSVVNLEPDLIMKYLEALLPNEQSELSTLLSRAWS